MPVIFFWLKKIKSVLRKEWVLKAGYLVLVISKMRIIGPFCTRVLLSKVRVI